MYVYVSCELAQIGCSFSSLLSSCHGHLRENELLAVNLVDCLDDVVGFIDHHHCPLQPDAHGGARLSRQESGVGHHNQLTTTVGKKERES